MRNLSKSKLMAYRQCPKRLWLEIHKPELKEESEATQASFSIGYQVGDIARKLYDPEGSGNLVDIDTLGFPGVFAATGEFLKEHHPIFEASFQAKGALALADVLLPLDNDSSAWRMVEVKSSTSVKDIHHDDIAVQAFIAQSSGLNLVSVSLAHIDSSWTYPGGGDYRGLLNEVDLSAEALTRGEEVQGWITGAQGIAARKSEPPAKIGAHCDNPYPCGFYDYCSKDEPKVEMPIQWLPRLHCNSWLENGIHDLRQIQPDLLDPIQQRVQDCTIRGKEFFDRVGAAKYLQPHALPGYFLDFETIQFAVPIWGGTRPYEQIPFQFSLHHLSADGLLRQEAFLDLSGKDPSRPFAEKLVAVCGSKGPVFVYNASFEKTRIAELGKRFPDLSKKLLAINDRVVDLLPIARNHYYHPSQQGSWSIKAVLPAAVPELSYENLEGVQNGGMAMEAYLEAIHPGTPVDRKAEIEKQLLAYCGLDTYAMVRLWQVFSSSLSGFAGQ
ncbi:MAG: DUF2779 domain-containing protein [Ferrovum sp.]|jgi:CRISPR/Cas system-associated exonuclease Cas4 (RecB family)|uniref:DUF2779 domain-containing protein n=1 Tax=Ferrovum sp. TaxID=2609467 RepID=UPI00260F9DE2|nr:DUF2779 domain-containing protein [Ferrovum sp.]MBW8067499.1 DUF2779 domain-containing protein [Ferrovum sp.]